MQGREYGPLSEGKPTRQDGSVSRHSVAEIDPFLPKLRRITSPSFGDLRAQHPGRLRREHMSFWITAWCTSSLSRLTADDLRRRAETYDFATMAENIGLTEQEGYAVQDALRFEPTSGGFLIHYLPEAPDWWMGMYRVTGA